MKLSQVNKIEIVRTAQNNWNAYVPDGPWSCRKTPERAFSELMRFLRGKSITLSKKAYPQKEGR